MRIEYQRYWKYFVVNWFEIAAFYIFLDNFGLNDPSDEHGSTFNHDKEVQMFRTVIRKSNLLENPHLKESVMSLDWQELHPDLVNFMTVAYQNFYKYVNHGKPVFITKYFQYRWYSYLNEYRMGILFEIFSMGSNY
jgi:hypothetical protein